MQLHVIYMQRRRVSLINFLCYESVLVVDGCALENSFEFPSEPRRDEQFASRTIRFRR